LDNDVILQQFEEIEQKVEKLIGVCQDLEAKNSEFSSKIRELENQLQKKAEDERRYTAEKSLIRTKIDSLLGRLDEIAESSS
jgi:chromosome segregation ATPase